MGTVAPRVDPEKLKESGLPVMERIYPRDGLTGSNPPWTKERRLTA